VGLAGWAWACLLCVLECVCIAHVLPDDEDEKEDEEEKVFQNI
jgi:hypothetical protein